MRRHSNRSHPRSASAMGDAEGFVEVEVADICPDVAGAAEAHLGVEVGSVHVDLTSGGVDHFADLPHALLENTMSRWVGHHEGGKVFPVLFDFLSEVDQIDVALVITGHRNNGHPCHDGTGWIGPVGGGGDEADMPLGLAARLVPGSDNEKTGVLAL